jgi:carbonic anhydrase
MTTNDILLAAAIHLNNLSSSDLFIDKCCTSNIDFARTYGTNIYHSRAIPSKQLAIICCMDARLDVYRMLGLQPGDANIIRNGK